MICILCKQASTQPGQTTVTLENAGLRLVVMAVPARICPVCGEAYTDEETALCLLALAEETQNAGLESDVRTYGMAA